MTLNEFNAWLEGFSQSFQGGAPTRTQWLVILQKLRQISTGETYTFPLEHCTDPNHWPLREWTYTTLACQTHNNA